VNTIITENPTQENPTQETRDFYLVVRPSNTCLLPRCGVPMDEGCTQPLSSDPMINLNTTVFFLRLSPVCEESPQLGASRPYNDDHKRSTEVREGRATHTRLKSSTPTHTREDHRESLTRIELKSLTQRNECAGIEYGCLRMLSECA
jgi:hypothetical protein